MTVPGQRKRPPVGSEDREISTWIRDDSRAKGALLGACTLALSAHIESAETSADMWTILSKCANSADTIKGRQNLHTLSPKQTLRSTHSLRSTLAYYRIPNEKLARPKPRRYGNYGILKPNE